MTLADIVTALDREIGNLQAVRALLIPFSSERQSTTTRPSKKLVKPAVRSSVRTLRPKSKPPTSQISLLPDAQVAPKTVVLKARSPKVRIVRIKRRPLEEVALSSHIPAGPIVVSPTAVRDELLRRTISQAWVQESAESSITSFSFGDPDKQERPETKEKLDNLTRQTERPWTGQVHSRMARMFVVFVNQRFNSR